MIRKPNHLSREHTHLRFNHRWAQFVVFNKLIFWKTAFLFKQANVLTLVNRAAKLKAAFATSHLTPLQMSLIRFLGWNSQKSNQQTSNSLQKCSLAALRATCRHRHTWGEFCGSDVLVPGYWDFHRSINFRNDNSGSQRHSTWSLNLMNSFGS